MRLAAGWSFAGRLGVWLLAGFGALVLAIFLFLWALWSGALDRGKPAEVEAAAVRSVPGETAALDAGQAACLCSAGASCVGPRGGVYCVSDAGSKRYLKGQ